MRIVSMTRNFLSINLQRYTLKMPKLKMKMKLKPFQSVSNTTIKNYSKTKDQSRLGNLSEAVEIKIKV